MSAPARVGHWPGLARGEMRRGGEERAGGSGRVRAAARQGWCSRRARRVWARARCEPCAGARRWSGGVCPEPGRRVDPGGRGGVWKGRTSGAGAQGVRPRRVRGLSRVCAYPRCGGVVTQAGVCAGRCWGGGRGGPAGARAALPAWQVGPVVRWGAPGAPPTPRPCARPRRARTRAWCSRREPRHAFPACGRAEDARGGRRCVAMFETGGRAMCVVLPPREPRRRTACALSTEKRPARMVSTNVRATSWGHRAGSGQGHRTGPRT